jgi:hypothetical protein
MCRGVHKLHPLLRAPRAAVTRNICMMYADMTRMRQIHAGCVRHTRVNPTQMLRALPYEERTSDPSVLSLGPTCRPTLHYFENNYLTPPRFSFA